MTPVPAPFLAGVILSPLSGRIVKPVFQAAVKSTVRLVVEAKEASRRAQGEVRTMAAEATVRKSALATTPVSEGPGQAPTGKKRSKSRTTR